MASPSIRASIYSCSHPLVNGEHAERLQSARTFDPALNVVSGLCKEANDAYSGRPSSHNAANGVPGISTLGYAGLNPNDYMLLETGLRQVEFREHYPHTTFYDTIEGTNRSNWYSQFAGKTGTTCALYNGPDSYTSTPYQTNNYGQTTSVDRQRYLQALQREYRKNQGQYQGNCP